MPFINVKLIEDVFTPDQKKDIIQKLTDAMVSIEGESMRAVTWVVVEKSRATTPYRRSDHDHCGREEADRKPHVTGVALRIVVVGEEKFSLHLRTRLVTGPYPDCLCLNPRPRLPK